MSRFIAFAVACVAATAALADPPSLRQSELRKITVDAAATVGSLRSLQGVDGAPGPGGHKPENFTFGGWNMKDDVDASAGYRRARIDLVRTHDGYGPSDIDARFESADPQCDGAWPRADDHASRLPRVEADSFDDGLDHERGPRIFAARVRR